MAAFSNALTQILNRSFGGKLAALAAVCGIPGPELGRLSREETPLTAQKLQKLLSSSEISSGDRDLLINAAVCDFVGEAEYKARFGPKNLNHQDDLGGVIFRSMFPLRPKAARTLRYLVKQAGVDGDVASILEIVGNMLELPDDDAAPGSDVEALIDEAAKEIREAKPPGKKSGKSGKTA